MRTERGGQSIMEIFVGGALQKFTTQPIEDRSTKFSQISITKHATQAPARSWKFVQHNVLQQLETSVRSGHV